MKIEPFGERVAIRVLPLEEKTASGLVLASSKNNSNRGEVVAIGKGAEEYFAVGEKVIFTQNTGVNYTDGNEDFKVIGTKDVICKIIED